MPATSQRFASASATCSRRLRKSRSPSSRTSSHVARQRGLGGSRCHAPCGGSRASTNAADGGARRSTCPRGSRRGASPRRPPSPRPPPILLAPPSIDGFAIGGASRLGPRTSFGVRAPRLRRLRRRRPSSPQILAAHLPALAGGRGPPAHAFARARGGTCADRLRRPPRAATRAAHRPRSDSPRPPARARAPPARSGRRAVSALARRPVRPQGGLPPSRCALRRGRPLRFAPEILVDPKSSTRVTEARRLITAARFGVATERLKRKAITTSAAFFRSLRREQLSLSSILYSPFRSSQKRQKLENPSFFSRG